MMRVANPLGALTALGLLFPTAALPLSGGTATCAARTTTVFVTVAPVNNISPTITIKTIISSVVSTATVAATTVTIPSPDEPDIGTSPSGSPLPISGPISTSALTVPTSLISESSCTEFESVSATEVTTSLGFVPPVETVTVRPGSSSLDGQGNGPRPLALTETFTVPDGSTSTVFTATLTVTPPMGESTLGAASTTCESSTSPTVVTFSIPVGSGSAVEITHTLTGNFGDLPPTPATSATETGVMSETETQSFPPVVVTLTSLHPTPSSSCSGVWSTGAGLSGIPNAFSVPYSPTPVSPVVVTYTLSTRLSASPSVVTQTVSIDQAPKTPTVVTFTIPANQSRPMLTPASSSSEVNTTPDTQPTPVPAPETTTRDINTIPTASTPHGPTIPGPDGYSHGPSSPVATISEGSTTIITSSSVPSPPSTVTITTDFGRSTVTLIPPIPSSSVPAESIVQVTGSKLRSSRPVMPLIFTFTYTVGSSVGTLTTEVTITTETPSTSTLTASSFPTQTSSGSEMSSRSSPTRITSWLSTTLPQASTTSMGPSVIIVTLSPPPALPTSSGSVPLPFPPDNLTTNLVSTSSGKSGFSLSTLTITAVSSVPLVTTISSSIVHESNSNPSAESPAGPPTSSSCTVERSSKVLSGSSTLVASTARGAPSTIGGPFRSMTIPSPGSLPQPSTSASTRTSFITNNEPTIQPGTPATVPFSSSLAVTVGLSPSTLSSPSPLISESAPTVVMTIRPSSPLVTSSQSLTSSLTIGGYGFSSTAKVSSSSAPESVTIPGYGTPIPISGPLSFSNSSAPLTTPTQASSAPSTQPSIIPGTSPANNPITNSIPISTSASWHSSLSALPTGNSSFPPPTVSTSGALSTTTLPSWSSTGLSSTGNVNLTTSAPPSNSTLPATLPQGQSGAPPTSAVNSTLPTSLISVNGTPSTLTPPSQGGFTPAPTAGTTLPTTSATSNATSFPFPLSSQGGLPSVFPSNTTATRPPSQVGSSATSASNATLSSAFATGSAANSSIPILSRSGFSPGSTGNVSTPTASATWNVTTSSIALPSQSGVNSTSVTNITVSTATTPGNITLSSPSFPSQSGFGISSVLPVNATATASRHPSQSGFGISSVLPVNATATASRHPSQSGFGISSVLPVNATATASRHPSQSGSGPTTTRNVTAPPPPGTSQGGPGPIPPSNGSTSNLAGLSQSSTRSTYTLNSTVLSSVLPSQSGLRPSSSVNRTSFPAAAASQTAAGQISTANGTFSTVASPSPTATGPAPTGNVTSPFTPLQSAPNQTAAGPFTSAAPNQTNTGTTIPSNATTPSVSGPRQSGFRPTLSSDKTISTSVLPNLTISSNATARPSLSQTNAGANTSFPRPSQSGFNPTSSLNQTNQTAPVTPTSFPGNQTQGGLTPTLSVPGVNQSAPIQSGEFGSTSLSIQKQTVPVQTAPPATSLPQGQSQSALTPVPSAASNQTIPGQTAPSQSAPSFTSATSQSTSGPASVPQNLTVSGQTPPGQTAPSQPAFGPTSTLLNLTVPGQATRSRTVSSAAFTPGASQSALGPSSARSQSPTVPGQTAPTQTATAAAISATSLQGGGGQSSFGPVSSTSLNLTSGIPPQIVPSAASSSENLGPTTTSTIPFVVPSSVPGAGQSGLGSTTSAKNASQGTVSPASNNTTSTSMTGEWPQTSKSSPSPSATCGTAEDSGNFTLNFDDLPQQGVESGTDPASMNPVPLNNPYHRFWFSPGFGFLPPPPSPYVPSSPNLMIQYDQAAFPNGTANGIAQIGIGTQRPNPCFRFDFVGFSLGCNSTGLTCVFNITGWQNPGRDPQDTPVASQLFNVTTCSAQSNCNLTPVVADRVVYSNLSSITITLTVGNSTTQTWWGDDLQLGWSNNTCDMANCRARVRSSVMKRDRRLRNLFRPITSPL